MRALSRKYADAVSEFTRLQIVVIFSLVGLIALGGIVAYVRSRPREVKIEEKGVAAQGDSPTLTVHVAGAVSKPGLYRLKEGARVADALQEAGGATQEGMVDDLNLAARVKDGEKVFVPSRQQQEPAEATGDGKQGAASQGGGLVHINTAGADELEKLPGVGPSLAQSIIDYRKRNGPFSSVEELDNVSGIGPAKLGSLRDLVTL